MKIIQETCKETLTVMVLISKTFSDKLEMFESLCQDDEAYDLLL